MPDFQFTEEAEDDVRNIIDYTLHQWGKLQALNYLDGLEKQAADLAANPELGISRASLFEGLYSFPYVSHTIFYKKSQYGILIVRVLHQSMDVGKHLESS